MVIVGRPKSGKTRLVWELLRRREEALVVIPDTGSPRPPDVFEGAGLVGKRVVLFVDDLHSVAQTMEPLKWRDRLEKASKQSCLLICASRDGSDWAQVDKEQSRLLDELGSESTVFVSRVGGVVEEEGEDFSREQGRHLAGALGLTMEEFDRRFDGTPGSLVLDLKDMRRRYNDLRRERFGEVSMSRLLDSAKLLHEVRQPSFHAPTLRAVAEEIRGNGRMSPETWDALVQRTQEEGFASFDDGGNLLTYRPYLEQCVSYKPSSEEIVDLQPILSRERDSNGLLYLGVFWGEAENYIRALNCFEEVIRLYPDSIDALGSKGIALHSMGRHEEALVAYDAALEIRPNDAAALTNKIATLLMQEKKQEAVEHLCRSWRNRERLTDQGASLAELFEYLNMRPEECQ